MSLNPKQQRFVEEYLVDLNGTQAAIRAGYSPKTAEVQASRLLSNAKVQQAVAEGRARLSQSTGITQERVLQEYARIAFSDPRHAAKWNESSMTLVPSDELSDDAAAAIQEVSVKETLGQFGGSVSVKIKHHDKIRALDFLARHLGMAPEKVDVSVKLKDMDDSKLLELGQEALETLRKAK